MNTSQIAAFTAFVMKHKVAFFTLKKNGKEEAKVRKSRRAHRYKRLVPLIRVSFGRYGDILANLSPSFNPGCIFIENTAWK
jgi:hypothetical protein